MSIQNRKNILLLLLVLVISHAALTLHASSHVAAEQQNCHLCTHYSDLANALPPSVASCLLPVGYAAKDFTESTRLPAVEAAPYHQRAPPYVA